MLVLGGTPKFNSNRMAEDACSLTPCINPHIHLAIETAISSQSITQIHAELVILECNNVNIVGPRGIVYDSGKLAKNVKLFMKGTPSGLPIPFNTFPRTMGLRKAIIKAVEKFNG